MVQRNTSSIWVKHVSFENGLDAENGIKKVFWEEKVSNLLHDLGVPGEHVEG
jgi:hypothetical protein